MICPTCNEPYLFLDPLDGQQAACLRCAYREPFRQPEYGEYHQALYAKPYRRDRHSDPQMRKILRSLRVQADDQVIDLGCGVGDYTRALQEYTPKVLGLDLSVEAARSKFPEINFRSHDLNTPLPFPDGAFDKLVSINLIEHLVAPRNFLHECRRILKNHAMIVITTANLDFFLHDWFYDKTHLHEWTVEQFSNIAEDYFQIIYIGKSSSMFNYYPLNFLLTLFLKPDILFIGIKRS